MIFVASNSQFRKSCAACIRARAACDHNRPCSRCVSLRCTDKCADVERKRRAKKPKSEPGPSPSNPQHLSLSNHPQPPALVPQPPPSSLLNLPQPPSFPSQSPAPPPQSLPSISSMPSTTLPPLPSLQPLPPPPFSTLPPPQSPLAHSRNLRSPSTHPPPSPSPLSFTATGTPDIAGSSVASPPPAFYANYDINLPPLNNFEPPFNESLLDFNASTGSPKPPRTVALEQSTSEESSPISPASATSTSTASPSVSSPSSSSVVEASEYTFTCHRLPDYVSDLLSTYLALQKLSLAHRSTSPISISFDAKCEAFDPQPVIMLHKTTLEIVDCNLPFANFIGYTTVSEFLGEKNNFSDLITPNGVAMSKRTYQHFLNSSVHKVERLELMKTKHAGTKAVTIQSHITERHTIITLTEFFHDMPMCFLAPFIKRCLPNIQLVPCRRTHCQCVYADVFY